MRSPKVVSLGVHLLDVIARPVPGPPVPGGRTVLEEFRLTAAGTSAGTAVDLAKLGADVVVMGVLGADVEGEIVTEMMRRHDVDTSHLVHAEGQATQVSVLLVGADGERHTVFTRSGANDLITIDDIDFEAIAEADALHIGGADMLGEFAAGPLVEVIRFARRHGALTTCDVLADCDGNTVEALTPALREAQCFFPNERQLAGMSGSEDPAVGATVLRELGVQHVVVTLGEAGSLIVGPGGATRVPAVEVELIDTTGCGDAYVAGFIIAMTNGWDFGAAGWLGTATAGLVATGLGSDAGIVDLPSTLAFLAAHAPPPIADLAGSVAGT